MNRQKTERTFSSPTRVQKALELQPGIRQPVSGRLSFFSDASITIIVFLAWVCFASLAQAQPTIVSTVPPLLATGVSPSAPVSFTFSTAMDTDATSAQFGNFSSFPPTFYTTTPSWNAAGTVLTCQPTPDFPSNQQITWIVSGTDTLGNDLTGQTAGFFTTGSGGGTTGFGTNAVTRFSLGTVYSYQQISPSLPTLDTNDSFVFNAITVLASNRTASTITLTFPNLAVSNLTQNIVSKENYYLLGSETESNTFVTAYPQGQYTFIVNATASNQTVSVTLPAASTQPNAPHLTNFAAAQAVSASQPFTLAWDAFAGGTSSDFIDVTIGNNDWTTPIPGSAGALNGTVKAVTIPAGALEANSNYTGRITFYDAVVSSNATYVTQAYRATTTQFPLITVGPVVAAPSITNAVWNGSSIGFDIDTTPGQDITVLYSTNCLQPVNQWPVLVTTNSQGASRVHVTDSPSPGKSMLFYRARTGR